MHKFANLFFFPETRAYVGVHTLCAYFARGRVKVTGYNIFPAPLRRLVIGCNVINSRRTSLAIDRVRVLRARSFLRARLVLMIQ